MGNGKKYKNGRRQTTFGFKNEKKVQFYKIFWKIFFYHQNKKQFIYIHFYLIYHLPNFEKKNFMYFRHKHVGTRPKLFTWNYYFSTFYYCQYCASIWRHYCANTGQPLLTCHYWRSTEVLFYTENRIPTILFLLLSHALK